jgi:hypothetical protein
LTPINLDEEETQDYAKTFCCKIGNFPFIYLGAPLHYERLRRENIHPIVDKIMKRILGWKGRLLSYGARLTLLKACLASIPKWLSSFGMIMRINIDIIYLTYNLGALRRIKGIGGP